ncbi:MAG: S1C family serine protease [Gemmatimonadaceae bacterium]
MPAAGSTTLLQTLSDDLAGAAERAGASVVAIHARRRIPSSGVIWAPDVIVTASHTLQREDDLQVTLANGEKVPATLGGRDPATDIALLRFDAAATPATIDSGDSLRVGQMVLALGRPGPSITAALGIVSAVGGEWRTWHGGRIDRFVRLDLAIYDGFSGGPLVDGSGRVLGINTSALSRSAALTIPASTVSRVAEQLKTTGRVRRGYIGIAGQPVRIPDDLVRSLSLAQEIGLMVVGVDDGGPAHKAGVLLGDVVITFDGEAVEDPGELMAALSADRVGSEVPIGVIRAGRREQLRVTVADRPSASGETRRVGGRRR